MLPFSMFSRGCGWVTKAYLDPERFQMRDLKRRIAKLESRSIRQADILKRIRGNIAALKDYIKDDHQDREEEGDDWN